MFIGDRRTTRSIRAFRTPDDLVVIPKDAMLRDVRTGVEGYRFPAALRIMARRNPNMYIFEYRGETLYMHEAHGLVEATTGVELDPLLECDAGTPASAAAGPGRTRATPRSSRHSSPERFDDGFAFLRWARIFSLALAIRSTS